PPGAPARISFRQRSGTWIEKLSTHLQRALSPRHWLYRSMRRIARIGQEPQEAPAAPASPHPEILRQAPRRIRVQKKRNRARNPRRINRRRIRQRNLATIMRRRGRAFHHHRLRPTLKAAQTHHAAQVRRQDKIAQPKKIGPPGPIFVVPPRCIVWPGVNLHDVASQAESLMACHYHRKKRQPRTVNQRTRQTYVMPA